MSKRKQTAVSGKSRKQTGRDAKGARATGKANIYELKITLLRTKPPIWRRFAVPGDITLADLHDVIQTVMGWDDCHLHHFIDKNETRYSSGFLAEDDPDVIEGVRVRLRDVVGKVGSRLRYEYDFGDGWEHRLEVVSIGAPKPDIEYPTCVAGKRACPPEDCGGTYGYDDLLNTIADPKHEGRESMLEWLGGDFDPEAFDMQAVNERLR